MSRATTDGRLDRRAVILGVALSGCSPRRPPSDGPFPSKDVTFIIPRAAGGEGDIAVRFVCAAMEREWSERVSVTPQNIPSGGGGKGVTQLFRAAPDGYTIGTLGVPGIFVLQRVQRLPYDFSRFTWLGTMTEGTRYGLATGRNSPLRSVDDLVRLSREREVTFAATGPESTAYMATRMTIRVFGLRARIVTGYTGVNDYVIGAMRGDTDVIVTPMPVLQRVSDLVRALAAFEEVSTLEGVPSAVELGHPELALISVERVLAGPPDMPADVKDALVGVLAEAVRDRDLNAWATRTGNVIAWGTPEETAALVAARLEFLNRCAVGGACGA